MIIQKTCLSYYKNMIHATRMNKRVERHVMTIHGRRLDVERVRRPYSLQSVAEGVFAHRDLDNLKGQLVDAVDSLLVAGDKDLRLSVLICRLKQISSV